MCARYESHKQGKVGASQEMQQLKQFVSNQTIESVRRLLDIHFSPMESFFEKAFLKFEENICSVLITRRCFLMAEWFLGLFMERETFARDFELRTMNSVLCIHNRRTQRVNYIISDKGIPLLRTLKDIEEIHILDDICIHGRQLEKIKDLACKFSRLSNSQVKKWVFMRSSDSQIMDVDQQEIDVMNGNWVLPSQHIVESINYLMLPYVSYTNSFVKFNVSIKENDNFLDLLERDNSLIVEEFGKDNRLQLGKQSFYIIERDECAKNEVGRNLACLRYYYNFETGIASFIPYVVLQALPQGMDEAKLRASLLEYLNEQSANLIINEVNGLFRGRNKEGVGYIYSLLSCIASCHYGICFAAKHKLGKFNFIDEANGWGIDIINSMIMAFGEKIATIIANHQNYISPNQEKTSGDKIQVNLVDMKEEVDDFEIERWIQRELAVENLENDTFNNEFFSLMEDATIKWQSQKKKEKKEEEKKGVLMYSFLRSVISDCDNGRLNISSSFESKNSLLEVGELGVLTVREKNDITVTGIRQLLRKPYYYYILC